MTIDNREPRIIGRITKPRYVPPEVIEFDATRYILMMDLDSIRTLTDASAAAAQIAVAYTRTNDTFDVEIVNSACEFFGVPSLDELTEERLCEKRAGYEGSTMRITFEVTYDLGEIPPERMAETVRALREALMHPPAAYRIASPNGYLVVRNGL